jgi:hypothetical protein
MSIPTPSSSLGSSVELALMQSLPQAMIVLSGLGNASSSTNTPKNAGGPLRAIVGFVTSNITIGGANCFQSPFDTALLSALTLVANGGMTLLTQAGVLDKISQIRLSTQGMTTQVWLKSETPIFRATMVFLAIKETDDVRTPVRRILRSVYPNFSADSALMKAPLGYDGGGNGTFTVKIGAWFQANSMVMRSANFSFSKEVLASGAPLYAEGNIEFMPWQMVSGDDIAGYIQGGTNE